MPTPYLFSSKRLGFRTWKMQDKIPFAQMNIDQRVMEFFPHPLSTAQSDAFLQRIQNAFDERGYGLYAVEELKSKQLIGFIGFIYQTFEADFTPCVEIGWRLLPDFWGKGYATEGATACLNHGFYQLGFQSVYSFTAVVNNRSEKVMKKIGLQKVKEFDHPKLEADSWLLRHILYKIDKKEFTK